MDKHQLEALDRRNRAEQRLVIQKLDSICKTVEENKRALRGSNGDAGIVADIAIIKKDVKDNQDDIKELKNGRKWRNRALLGAGFALVADVIVRVFFV